MLNLACAIPSIGLRLPRNGSMFIDHVVAKDGGKRRMKSVRNAFFIVGLLLLFYPISAPYFYIVWNDPDYSYCLIIPFISAWIAFGKMKQKREFSDKSSPLSLAILLTCLALYVFGVLVHFAFLARIGLVGTLIGMVWFVGGNERFRFYSFPLLFLLLAVPPPLTLYNAASLPLKLLATKVSIVILDWVGIVAIHEGNIIYLGSGVLEVANACSGLRSMTALATLAVLLAYYSGLTLRGAGLLICCSVPIAFIANLGRIIFLSVMLEKYSLAFIKGPNHSLVGLGVFIVGFFLLLVAARLLKSLGFMAASSKERFLP